VASIVDLSVFWQPGSMFDVLNCHGLLFFFLSQMNIFFFLQH